MTTDPSASQPSSRRLKPKRLAILTDLDWPEFEGHEITKADWSGYDLVIGSKAWLMDDAHRKYVKDAIAEARRRRYPKEAREQPE